MKVNAITIWFRRNRRIRAVIASYPAVIDDGNTVGWFDYLANITKDDSNFVSVWGDKSGLAHNLLQATGDAQPLWSANGVLFDGIDNFMKCVAFTWNQPEFIYMVMKQVTWTNYGTIFDGNTFALAALRQRSITPGILIRSGTESLLDSNLALNNWGIIRALFSGADSRLTVNNNTPTLGVLLGTGSAGGFTLGQRGDLAGSYANIEVKEIIGRSSVLGEAEIYAYLAAKYGI